MMQEFLERYGKAINLNGEQYDGHFPEGVKRADFLLFDGQVICEAKKIQNIKVQHQVEKIASRGNLSKQNFKRDFYNPINNHLKTANKQIKESKKALNYPDALGLVVLENLIETDLSVLSLIDASIRKMRGGLEHVDGVLCLDRVNVFSGPDGEPFSLMQLVGRDPDSERSARLSELMQQLESDFCEHLGTPFYNNFTIKTIEQVWQTKQGKYWAYKAKFDLQTPTIETTPDWKKQLANFLNKWWWVIPLPSILCDQFIR